MSKPNEKLTLTLPFDFQAIDLEAMSSRTKALAALGLTSIAFLVAALGQAAINRDVGDKASWLGPLADPLRGIYSHPQSVLLGAILLAAGGLLFAIAVASSGRAEEPTSAKGAALRSWLKAGRSLWLVLALAGVGLWAYLLAKLSGGSYKEFYPHLLAGAFLLVAATFFLWDRRLRASLSFRVEWWEVAFLAAVIGLFVGLNVQDLDGWRYSAIGDEYAFFDVADRIASGGKTNLFSAIGVYDYRPVGGSAFQAAAMNVFGEDNFGWKMSNVLLIVATIPAIYFLTRHLFHRWVAIVATAILGFSHHVFAYTHIGYDNIQVILPSVLAFALFIPGLKRSSTLLLFGAGVVAGLTAYTYPAARVVPIIMVVYLFTLGWRHWKVQTLLPLGVGAVMAVAPMLAVSGEEFWTAMSDRSVFGFTDSPTEGVGQRILENIPRTLFIFNFNPDRNDHFVSGSILDPVSAVFYVMGLAVAVARFRQNSYRFLLIWLGIGLLTTGILSPYNRTPEDRVQFDIPAVAVVAGIGVYETLRLFTTPAPTWVARYGPALFLAGLLPLILVLNSIRFWVETPESTATSVESVIARAVFSSECSGPGRQTVVIAPEPVPLLTPLFRSYDLGDRAPLLVSFEDAMQNSDFDASQCFVLSNLSDPRAESIQSTLNSKYPQKQTEILSDSSGLREVLIYR